MVLPWCSVFILFSPELNDCSAKHEIERITDHVRNILKISHHQRKNAIQIVTTQSVNFPEIFRHRRYASHVDCFVVLDQLLPADRLQCRDALLLSLVGVLSEDLLRTTSDSAKYISTSWSFWLHRVLSRQVNVPAETRHALCLQYTACPSVWFCWSRAWLIRPSPLCNMHGSWNILHTCPNV